MNSKISIFPKFFIYLRLFIILLGMTGILTACASVDVSQDYVKDFRFASATTFNWNEKLQSENNTRYQIDELMAKRFRRAINEVLTKKGLRQTPQPELLITYTYTITNKLQVDDFNPNFGFGYGWYGRRYGGIGIDTGNVVQQYDQGKLEIYMHSAKTGELLWKGTGTREVFTHSSPDEITRRVNEMVEAILAQFPPAGP